MTVDHHKNRLLVNTNSTSFSIEGVKIAFGSVSDLKDFCLNNKLEIRENPSRLEWTVYPRRYDLEKIREICGLAGSTEEGLLVDLISGLVGTDYKPTPITELDELKNKLWIHRVHWHYAMTRSKIYGYFNPERMTAEYQQEQERLTAEITFHILEFGHDSRDLNAFGRELHTLTTRGMAVRNREKFIAFQKDNVT